MGEDESLTLKEVADDLKLIERMLYRPTLDGKLPGFKVGSSWRFRRQDIDVWSEDQEAEVRRDGDRQ